MLSVNNFASELYCLSATYTVDIMYELLRGNLCGSTDWTGYSFYNEFL